MLAQTGFVILPFEVLDTSWWWLSLFMGCKSLTIDMAEECPPKVLSSKGRWNVKCSPWIELPLKVWNVKSYLLNGGRQRMLFLSRCELSVRKG
ncbi:MAG: hypothetical protein ACTS4W_01140 [Candidatus Hodgkinia cicadicola]